MALEMLAVALCCDLVCQNGGSQTSQHVIDSGADGLKMDSPPNQAFDITWRDGRAQTMMSGEWKDQKLTSKEYQDGLARQEAAYAVFSNGAWHCAKPDFE